jgi:glycosyltransferase involved in cell wall biosynthesis
MKLVVLYQYYQGHGAPGHSLVYDLTQFLAEKGHDVTVISGETGYMEINVEDLPWYQRIFRQDKNGKVNVVRTYTYSELHRSYFGRLLSFISFSISAPLGLLRLQKPDVVLASSPPIFPMFSVWLVCKLRGIPFVIEVRDLWPESGIQMGILKNKYLIKIMQWMEKLLYDHSLKIIALTDGIRNDICSRGWSKNKVELVTCGVDFDKLYPDKLGGEIIREKYGWQDKKIVMYFGALGEANNIPVIIQAAKILQNHEKIVFVLVGDGMKKNEIMEDICSYGLTNITLLPPVPKFDARSFINAADICLVTLRDIPLFEGAIPTKLIDYMACGKAVLCGVRGEAVRIISESAGGVFFDPDNSHQLSENIISLIDGDDELEKIGAKGLNYVKSHFSANLLRQQIEKILLEIVEGNKNSVVVKETIG